MNYDDIQQAYDHNEMQFSSMYYIVHTGGSTHICLLGQWREEYRHRLNEHVVASTVSSCAVKTTTPINQTIIQTYNLYTAHFHIYQNRRCWWIIIVKDHNA